MMISFQVTLLKVKRTLDLRQSVSQNRDVEAKCLASMIGYLRALENEYVAKYLDFSDRQRYDEAVTKARFEAKAKEDVSYDPGGVVASHAAWDWVCDNGRFPVLHDLRTYGEQYEDRFRNPLDDLAAVLLESKAPPPDPAFDERVTSVAKDGQSRGPASIETVRLGQCASGNERIARLKSILRLDDSQKSRISSWAIEAPGPAPAVASERQCPVGSVGRPLLRVGAAAGG